MRGRNRIAHPCCSRAATALLPLLSVVCLVAVTALAAEQGKDGSAASLYTIDLSNPDLSVMSGHLKMGGKNPQGADLEVNSRYLTLDGKPWCPVMGEFHYSRYPSNEWREELLKMKAGGIDIVATYVFWIHHEEVEGQFDWSGQCSLRHFIELCGEVGLKAVVRCGPWCHGEVRNGGLPDWILQKGWKTRSDDPNYLNKTQIFYGEIAGQLRGLLWKDGGPVIGIQVENEYGGPAEHLLTLKKIAREVGLDVPLYTRTGWPALRTPMPLGEILPLFGGYAEGFWDRALTPMPGRYWAAFRFSPLRSDSAIATDLLGNREAKDPADIQEYPYLTCEIGGGMMNSYHRRILIHPADVESTALVKLGSGSTLPGYYMYHGGENPDGKLTTLQETQATAFWNDLPVKNYDFQAPLGEYGQIRPHYHLLRRLHLFVHEWGPLLAGMPTVMPDQRPTGKDDSTTLRWAARSDGMGGFVFVNNYQRLQPMPAKRGVRFALKLRSGSLTFPSKPITVPADSRFVWPFNLDLGHGVRLTWATAQPVCAVDHGKVRTVFFAETTGVPAEFAFDGHASAVKPLAGRVTQDGRSILLRDVWPSAATVVRVHGRDGDVQIVLLDEAASTGLWKGVWQGIERVFFTRASLVLDGNSVRLTSIDPSALSVGIFPPPDSIKSGGVTLRGSREGVFRQFTPPLPQAVVLTATADNVQTAGPPRTITMGKIAKPVAEEPSDADFAQAAVWRIQLPRDLNLDTDPILRLHYVGDVARVTLDGKLLTDDFYNGNAFDIGLRRYAPAITKGELRVAILPLRKDAPIYMAKEARPDFGNAESVVELKSVEIVPRYQAQLEAGTGQ
jgi:beta-galactosidase